jgi:transcription initiation factor TFIID subunit 1
MATNGEESTDFNNIDWNRQDEKDEEAMQALLNVQPGEDSTLLDLNRPLDQGEKADDAEDFGDISDDDLPDEEDARVPNDGDVPGLTDDTGTSHDTDDLFGEGGRGSSPFNDDLGAQLNTDDLFGPDPEEVDLDDLRRMNFPGFHRDMNQDPNIPAPAESSEDFIKQLFPGFEKHTHLNWNKILPLNSQTTYGKVPLKQPRQFAPTKVSLDLAPDQEKAFRAPGTAQTDKRKRILEAEARGLVAIVDDSDNEKSDEEDFDWSRPDPNEKIGGVTWADLELICDDWESKINPPQPDLEVVDIIEEPQDEWEREFLGASAKRRKIDHKETDIINAPRYAVPNFDNFEQDTARIAKRVVLDLNDPYLLVDIQQFDPKAKQSGRGVKRGREGGFAATLKARFNYSNDEAYDALKENHQHKVRATLSNVAVEHSMPALKLQWPYYRVKLLTSEARSFHRPTLRVNKFVGQTIEFARLGMLKKKAVKGKQTQEVFAKSKDLTLADHYATATLLEYSEEHPTVLSNFGMGNRIINYYRRKDADDPERPLPEDKVGDVSVLLPEDKSPFANFGFVDPGETVRAIHNEMYRAPIFKHEPKSNDFLVIRTTTGVNGTAWHVRNIDNLFVVGQQFPSMEIPGPHSRRVTNAAKNRMKMIAYRLIRHNDQRKLKIGQVTAHIAESSDMQNRQKLKEFIAYDKTEKVWRMKPGEQVPEEPAIRSMVKPEDVCIIDAMQVGSRQLEDAGYDVNKSDENDEEDEERGLEIQLTPWFTTKAFLDASSGKAMLQLHGAGDPTGCGLGFSYIKISMKGGYIGAIAGPNATSEAAIEAERKANGGHTYNVRKQEAAYNDAIREIWDKQKVNLSNPDERAEDEAEREQAEEDARFGVGETPRSFATPIAFDDSASQFSAASHSGGKAMRITRTTVNRYGEEETTSEIVTDARIWREYQKRRHAIDAESMEYVSSRRFRRKHH